MKKAVSQRLCTIPLIFPLEQVLSTDVVAPDPTLTLSVIAICGFGILVTIIVFVSILVIRVIKRNQTSKDDTQS